MIRFVLNELGRHDGLVDFKITFIDESGNGIRRIRVDTGSGELLVEEELDCPRIDSREIHDVRIEWTPLLAHADECGGEGSEGDTDHYTYNTSFDIRSLIPWDGPGENPCSTPETLREVEGTPCWDAGQVVRGIAAEIEDLCAELDRHRQARDYHRSRRNAYNAGATAALVVAFICLALSFKVPGPWSLILRIAFGILFGLALVLGSLAVYHAQEADRARRNIDEVEARLEEARGRYRSAVEAAVSACCGILPTGIEIDPPVCE